MRRDHYPTGETVDLGRLPELWQLVDRHWKAVLTVDERSGDLGLTARMLDEASPSGSRLYINASQHLAMAMDNHRALLALLEHHGATLSAPWNLLRPVMEAAFMALWALEPDDGGLRRKRALRLEVLDFKSRQNWLETYGSAPRIGLAVRERAAEFEATTGHTYRAAAAAVGLTWQQAGARVNLSDELPKLRFAHEGIALPGYILLGTWRALSGIQHGSGYAMMASSDLSEPIHIPGGAIVHAVINDEAFSGAGVVVALLLCAACELYVRRCTRPD